MKGYADKDQASKSKLLSNPIAQQKRPKKTSFQFVDNRPEAIAQRKLQAIVNNSSQAKQLAQLQAVATNYTRQQQQPIQKKENKTGLPDKLKSGVENLSGYSMDDVKVHYNSDKPTQLQAHAYAQGTDIHLAPGQEKHLPHEAWHVVQQKQGRVKPTMQMKGNVNINDDTGLEKEADVMGAKAMQSGTQLKAAGSEKTVQQKGKGVVQRGLFSKGKKILVSGEGRTNDNVDLHTTGNNVFSKLGGFLRTKTVGKGQSIGIVNKRAKVSILSDYMKEKKEGDRVLVKVHKTDMETYNLKKASKVEKAGNEYFDIEERVDSDENENENYIEGFMAVRHIDFGFFDNEDNYHYGSDNNADNKRLFFNEIANDLKEAKEFLEFLIKGKTSKKEKLKLIGKEIGKKTIKHTVSKIPLTGQVLDKVFEKLPKTGLEKKADFMEKYGLGAGKKYNPDSKKEKVENLLKDFKSKNYKGMLKHHDIAGKFMNNEDTLYLVEMKERVFKVLKEKMNVLEKKGLINDHELQGLNIKFKEILDLHEEKSELLD